MGFYLKFIGNFVQYKGGTNIMRKLFSKLMSTTLSAAMLITLGAGTVGNVASAAEDDQADVSGVTYGYTAYVGFQTDGPYAYRDLFKFKRLEQTRHINMRHRQCFRLIRQKLKLQMLQV